MYNIIIIIFFYLLYNKDWPSWAVFAETLMENDCRLSHWRAEAIVSQYWKHIMEKLCVSNQLYTSGYGNWSNRQRVLQTIILALKLTLLKVTAGIITIVVAAIIVITVVVGNITTLAATTVIIIINNVTITTTIIIINTTTAVIATARNAVAVVDVITRAAFITVAARTTTTAVTVAVTVIIEARGIAAEPRTKQPA